MTQSLATALERELQKILTQGAWTETNAVTRAQAKQRDVSRPLVVATPEQWKAIDCDEIARLILQREDMSIQKYRSRTSHIIKRDQEVVFQERDNVCTEFIRIPR